MIGAKSSASTKVEGTQVAEATFHRTGEVMPFEAAFALEHVPWERHNYLGSGVVNRCVLG